MYTDKTCYIEYMAGYTDNIRCDTTVSFNTSKAATGQLVYIYIYILRIYVVYVCVCFCECMCVCVRMVITSNQILLFLSRTMYVVHFTLNTYRVNCIHRVLCILHTTYRYIYRYSILIILYTEYMQL